MTEPSCTSRNVLIPRWVLNQLNGQIGAEALRDAVIVIRMNVSKARPASAVFSKEGFSSFVKVTLPSGQGLSLRVYWIDGNSGRQVTKVRVQ